jgi:sterol desaturase/sphingolipid hydroxylase (fatty acid hydroxylase superfamily)
VQLILTMAGATILSLEKFLIASPAIIILGVWERVLPCYGRRPALASQVKGVLFQLVGLMAGIPLVVLVSSCLPRLPTLWPALAFPLALLIGDCLHYWEHRLEHMFLWRFHAVHHSTEDLSAASNFSHVTHNVFMTLIYGVPVGLLTHDPLGAPWVLICLYVEAAYVHSPAKLPLGPFRWIFNDNQVHRIHHSIEERHWNHNFGAFFTFWDFLFGTMHWPAKDEWPETGVPNYGEIDRLSDFLVRPFVRRASVLEQHVKPRDLLAARGGDGH